MATAEPATCTSGTPSRWAWASEPSTTAAAPSLTAQISSRCSGSLTVGEAAWAMNEIMDGAATSAQIAGFGVALRIKGETVEELSGLAQAMLDHATPISVPGRVADLVGTGGDGAHTVNISTMGAIVAAAAGARMAKHGNRAASSACGAADVLEGADLLIGLSGARILPGSALRAMNGLPDAA